MTNEVKKHYDLLFERYSMLENQKEAIAQMYEMLAEAYRRGGKLLICGNGGSAADSEHIVGELMKSFMVGRPLEKAVKEALAGYGAEGKALCTHLDAGLPAISLCGHPSLSTAFQNDVQPAMTFAQQVLSLGQKGDVLLAISTSGNSRNCVYAAMTARAKGMQVAALTGMEDSRLSAIADVTVKAPSKETYEIQEYHLPIYHCVCAMLECEFFGQGEKGKRGETI